MPGHTNDENIIIEAQEGFFSSNRSQNFFATESTAQSYRSFGVNSVGAKGGEAMQSGKLRFEALPSFGQGILLDAREFR